MSKHQDVQNRMADAPELDSLRESSEKPSFVGRHVRSALLAVRSRTGTTVIMFIAILVALALIFWTGA